ncbi:hypothetical protein [Streptomyces sp. SYSU K21746]
MNGGKVAAVRRHCLGPAPASPYAAPARAADLSGLHRIAEFDPLRLLLAGVPVTLHQWPAAFHRSHAVLSAEVPQRQTAELGAALRRALAE